MPAVARNRGLVGGRQPIPLDVPGPACVYFFFFAAFFFVPFFFAAFFFAAIPNHLPVTQRMRRSPQTIAGTVSMVAASATGTASRETPESLAGFRHVYSSHRVSECRASTRQ